MNPNNNIEHPEDQNENDANEMIEFNNGHITESSNTNQNEIPASSSP